MLVTKTSTLTGQTRTKDLNITADQYQSWVSGVKLIQEAFPQLNSMDREFILTGMTQEEWDLVTNLDDEEEEQDED